MKISNKKVALALAIGAMFVASNSIYAKVSETKTDSTNAVNNQHTTSKQKKSKTNNSAPLSDDTPQNQTTDNVAANHVEQNDFVSDDVSGLHEDKPNSADDDSHTHDGDLIDDMAEPVPLEQIRSFIEVYQTIQKNYVDAISHDELFGLASQGLAERLDPYSRYLNADQYKQILEFTEGVLAEPKVKLEFDPSMQKWRVNNINILSEAYRKGLRNGQVIEKIGDNYLDGLEERNVLSMWRGAMDSKVNIAVAQDSALKDYELKRDGKVDYDVRPFLTEDQILVLPIRAFQQDTSAQVQSAIKMYQDKAHIRGILIDVRDNPGGLLSAAVDLADLFLDQGLIVTTKSRIEAPQRFQALPNQYPIHYPIAILQNRYSASASEVFAAALKEHQRAKVMGEKSYGKGAVQKLFPLQQGALQLTVAHYYTPDNHMIEGKGIQPDILLAKQKGQSAQQTLQQALEIFNQQLPR
ncbi:MULTISPECIES: S41 family peptidase [unclassified Acinetobacter]|uniref:S41 family peptidase n=1 Tax=unclassified Acinetobacter TaxID=196816 RepID=UPI0035BB76FA